MFIDKRSISNCIFEKKSVGTNGDEERMMKRKNGIK